MEKKSDPASAATERANRIHRAIETLKEPSGTKGSEPQEATPMSPREFIRKRMEELDTRNEHAPSSDNPPKK